MSVVLVRCSCESIVYHRGEKIENPIINLCNVTKIEKGKHAWYPDNIGFPTIEFTFIDGELVRWAFPVKTLRILKKSSSGYYTGSSTNNVETVLDYSERDAEYEKLITKFA